MIVKFFQGMAIGVAFILPGLSAGTVILLLGFYQELIEDLSRIHLKPYLPHLAGGAAGALAGVLVIGYLMEHFNELLTAFLLGMLVTSAHVVLTHDGKIKIRPLPLALAAAGFLVTWFIVCEPSAGLTVLPPVSLIHFLFGGALASATMLLPGVSGSAVLIILNLYDDAIIAVSRLQWLKLAFFGAGFLVGLFGLARLLTALYRRYSNAVAFLLAGLILGSTRVLLPARLTVGGFILAVAGGLLVIYFGSYRKRRTL